MTPTKPEHFIGKTNTIARVLFHSATKFKADKTIPPMDRRFLLTGPAGTGKTSLAMAVAAFATGNTVESILAKTSMNVEWVNGQSWTVDMVRQWANDGHYLPLYGDRLVKIVDEVDGWSPAAANEALSYADALPGHVLLICTTNKPVSALPERAQSRFKTHFFEAVQESSVNTWLCGKFPRLGSDWATKIAKSSGGNVRAAETDALSRLEYVEAMLSP